MRADRWPGTIRHLLRRADLPSAFHEHGSRTPIHPAATAEWLPPALQPLLAGDDPRPADENLLDQHAVNLGIRVGAQVGKDGQAVVLVGGLAYGREDDAA